MKKPAAIFLLTLFLFNIIGYRIIFYYALQHSDIQLEAALDKELYNESELVTVKVPLSVPYLTDQVKFERVDGEISFNGKIYKYVKRKVSGGNLILLCLPDYNKMRLKKEQHDFFKDANNLAQNTDSKKQENTKGNFKNVLSDYEHLQSGYLAALFDEQVSHKLSYTDARLRAVPHASPEQPPDWD